MHLNAIKTGSAIILAFALNNDQKDLSTAVTMNFSEKNVSHSDYLRSLLKYTNLKNINK